MNIVTRIFAMILLLGLSGLAGAQTAVTINASNAPYNSVNALRGVGIGSEFEIRNAALTAAAGAYRAQFGTSAMTKLKVNEQFKVKYQDGTSETANGIAVVLVAATIARRFSPSPDSARAKPMYSIPDRSSFGSSAGACKLASITEKSDSPRCAPNPWRNARLSIAGPPAAANEGASGLLGLSCRKRVVN